MALDVLVRVDEGGAYANLVLGSALDRSGLPPADRRLVTDLVYGTVRMRRACDHLVDRFLVSPPAPAPRNALRLGAYQLTFAGVPPHAAVGETVEATPRRYRALVNAVLRRVADAPLDPADPEAWPGEAVRLSVPDHVLAWLVDALGPDGARAALEVMDQPPAVTERSDGYVQDLASQWVADLVGAQAGERVADVCAAPGGKATALARAGAQVVAGDVRPRRAGLVAANARRLGLGPDRLAVLTADAAAPPLRSGAFDRVLVDAPCTGLGTLRRRADLRWRVGAGDADRLAGLQRRLVDAAVGLLRPGGVLVYSVCTLTREESLGVDAHVAARWPGLEPLGLPGEPWCPWGRGALLVPQAAGTDGMALFRYRTPT